MLTKNPQSLISSRFLLTPKLGNPTRMSLNSLSVYWNEWILKDKKGDPFSFIGVNRGNQDMADVDDDLGDEGIEDFVPHFTIDDGVLPPLSCCGTSSNRTQCLQALVTGTSKDNKAYRTTVKLVNTLEVSHIEYMVSIMADRIVG